MFQTMYKHSQTKPNRVGQKIVPEYVLSVDDNGCEVLVPCGKRNLYQFIQSSKDSCDLTTILNHLDAREVNGMITTFKYNDLKDAGLIDLSHAPKSLGDMHNICMHGEHLFNGLDLEIRKEFNFSTEKFVRSIGTKEFDDIMKKFADVHTFVEKKPKKEVKKKVEEPANE